MIRYPARLWHIVWFHVYLLWQIVRSSMVVGADILTPGSRMSAGFIEVPLRCRSRFEIMMMANMITLTPGTVTVGVHEASSTLWVHALYVSSPDELRAGIRAMEDRLLRATRLDGAPRELPRVGTWREVGDR